MLRGTDTLYLLTFLLLNQAYFGTSEAKWLLKEEDEVGETVGRLGEEYQVGEAERHIGEEDQVGEDEWRNREDDYEEQYSSICKPQVYLVVKDKCGFCNESQSFRWGYCVALPSGLICSHEHGVYYDDVENIICHYSCNGFGLNGMINVCCRKGEKECSRILESANSTLPPSTTRSMLNNFTMANSGLNSTTANSGLNSTKANSGLNVVTTSPTTVKPEDFPTAAVVIPSLIFILMVGLLLAICYLKRNHGKRKSYQVTPTEDSSFTSNDSTST